MRELITAIGGFCNAVLSYTSMILFILLNGFDLFKGASELFPRFRDLNSRLVTMESIGSPRFRFVR